MATETEYEDYYERMGPDTTGRFDVTPLLADVETFEALRSDLLAGVTGARRSSSASARSGSSSAVRSRPIWPRVRAGAEGGQTAPRGRWVAPAGVHRLLRRAEGAGTPPRAARRRRPGAPRRRLGWRRAPGYERLRRSSRRRGRRSPGSPLSTFPDTSRPSRCSPATTSTASPRSTDPPRHGPEGRLEAENRRIGRSEAVSGRGGRPRNTGRTSQRPRSPLRHPRRRPASHGRDPVPTPRSRSVPRGRFPSDEPRPCACSTNHAYA